MGLNGLSAGLLARDGMLAKHRGRWLLTMIVGHLIGVAVLFGPGLSGSSGNQFWLYASLRTFVVNCALRCFGFLALFTHIVTRRNPVFDGIVTLAKNRPFSVDLAATSRAPND